MRKNHETRWFYIAAIMFCMVAAVILPGKKADAATLVHNQATELIPATTEGEYHRLVMKKDGMAVIGGKSIYPGEYDSVMYMTIYHGSRAISEKEYINLNATSPYINKVGMFALKRGVYTVHVKLGTPSKYIQGSGYQPNYYQLATKLQYISSDQGGKSKKKATTIGLKKYKTGVIALTDAAGKYSDNKGEWYKFKLKKKTKVKLSLKASGEGRVNARVSGKVPYSYRSHLQKFINGKSTTLPKGTYYIRIYKGYKTDSYIYRIGLNRKVKI